MKFLKNSQKLADFAKPLFLKVQTVLFDLNKKSDSISVAKNFMLWNLFRREFFHGKCWKNPKLSTVRF